MKDASALNCERKNDLVGFLYDELSDSEAGSFARHLRECNSCQAEVTDFGMVRAEVVAWRDQSLAGLRSSAAVTPHLAQKRSALVALQQFFNLSPLWLKGALALASVLFCVLTALALLSLGQTEYTTGVAQRDTGNSQQQLDALVQRGVAEELQRQSNLIAPPAGTSTADTATNRMPPQRFTGRTSKGAANLLAAQAKRPLSRTEREQLAADLRLTSARNETDLELLEERINQ